MGRRPVRRGEAAAEDRADDRLRVAGALAEGPGDRARGVRRGVQRARRRQRLVHRGHHLRRRRQRRPGGGVRADDRRRRRRRDGERPGHRRPGATCRRPWPTAKIPRVASNVTQDDWGDPNAYPLDASGTGVTFLLPQALIDEDVNKIGLIRVDLAAASALIGPPRGRSTRATPPSPTTSRFRPAPPTSPSSSSARRTPASDGVTLALGEQEAIQVVRAGQQLEHRPDHRRRASARSRTATVAELGDFAEQMVFLWSFPPATADLPVYEALRADLAASGEEALQPENLKASPMRSWIGLYALLKMIRDAEMTDVHPRGHHRRCCSRRRTSRCWTCSAARTGRRTPNHPGIFKRAGINHWAIYGWDPDAKAPDGLDGNFVEKLEDQLRRGAVRLALRCAPADRRDRAGLVGLTPGGR